MPIVNINLGAAANDGTGDDLRTAGGKINANFADVTTSLDEKQPLATVLTNTTAAFTTEQASKLAGIEAGADVSVDLTTLSAAGTLADADSLVLVQGGELRSVTLAQIADYIGVVEPEPGDTTAPTLSSPTATATGATTASASVSTDEANGTLYVYLSTSASPPSAADLIAGTGAVSAGSQVVSATGVQTFTGGFTGLTAETAYTVHFLHRDAANNNSAIASDGFTTEAAATAATGLAVIFGRGQSNMDGPGLTDATKAANYGLSATMPTLQVSKETGATPTLADHDWINYNITDTGGGSLFGEADVQQAPAATISMMLAMAEEADDGTLFTGADELLLIKNAVAGQLLSTFLPGGAHWEWENSAVQNLLRPWRAGLATAPFMQYGIWFQGEADVGPAQDALSTDVETLNTYATRWNGGYDHFEARYGPQPPWFVCHIAELDVYCEYFNNTILPSFCGSRITVNSDGTLSGGIVDLANGQPTDRIIVDHPFNGSLHPTGAQIQAIGRGIIAAIKLLRPSTAGWSGDFPMGNLAPLFSVNPALSGAAGASSATFTATLYDNCTLYAAAVAAGAAAPTAAQIVAGTGGGIVSAANVAATISTEASVEVSGLAGGTEYDFYFAAAANSVNSAVQSVEAVTTTAAAQTSWQTGFNADPVYSNNNRTATSTSGAVEGLRALGVKSTGKHYVAVEILTGTSPQIGLYSSGFTDTGAGALNNRCAVLSSGQMRVPNGSGGETTIGTVGTPAATSIMHIAYDADADTIWAAKGAGDWNASATADPGTGAEGATTANMSETALYLAMTIPNTSGSGARILESGDAGTRLPSGFTYWMA